MKYWLCIFFIAFSLRAASQKYVKGTINNEYGQPVSFASVKFKKDSASIARSFCIADANGKYFLPVGQVQNGWIFISAVGFDDFNSFFRFSTADTLFLAITLQTSSKELPGIIVKNKPSIEISGDTTSYNVDRFKRGNESTVSELVSNIPGFATGPGGTLIYNGKIIDRVLINGDDISGVNYSKLVNSLDVNGIEKLQVIQNYSPGDNLIATLIAGKEQVLNIAYKKGFLRKLFGSVDGGLGLPARYYTAGFQTIGLFDKIKIVSISGINSTGNTNANANAAGIGIPADIRIDTENDIEVADLVPVATINNLATGVEGINSLYKNNSVNTMLNFLIKPVKKISIKGYFNFMHDRFGQQMDNTTTYFVEPSLIIKKGNEILRHLQKMNGFFSINYFPDSKNQLQFSWKHVADAILSTANTTLSANTGFIEKENSDEKQSGLRFSYNHVLTKDAALSFSGQYKYGFLSGDYTVSPALFNDFFNYPGFDRSLFQQDDQRETSLFAQMKYIQRINRHTFSLSFYGRSVKDRGSNLIAARSVQDVKWVGEDSVNNSKINWLTTGVILQDRWLVSRKITFSFSSELQLLQGELRKLPDGSEKVNEKEFRILPLAELGFKISQESRLNFSISYGNRFSGLVNAGYGYAVHDITSVYKNPDILQVRRTRSVNLFYSYTSLLNKKVILFSNLSLIATPLLNLNKIQPYQFFVFHEMLPTQRKTQVLNLLISGSKFYHGYRTQWSPTINLSKGNTYTIINDKEQEIKFNQVQLGLTFSTEINTVQVRSSVQYSVKSQQYLTTITNQYGTALLGINWKIGKRIFSDFNVRYNYLKIQQQNYIDFFAASVKIQCKSKNNKWEYGFSGTNIFDQSSFSISTLSEITLTNTNYKLYPRIVMSFVKYRF
ncbi:MAG TPA: carboxypeptidase-like regulatory domain-containing protein [Chitinophagaceae bacterium]|nr:carboxypeptidase-like regulatory domain-containing protein [Chitinophagaceae bacterium]